MIDLHSHILPGVDDGPPDWDGTMAMLAMAEEGGTSKIAATPHSHENWRYEEPAHVHIPRLVEQLNIRLEMDGLQIRAMVGQECMVAPNLAQELDAGLWPTLNGSRTVLMELPFLMWPNFTDDVIFDLQLAGYTVLLAHPERYKVIQDDPTRLQAIVERGVLTQITTTSVVGRNGDRVRDLTRTLIEHNWAHVLASDSHSTRMRHPQMAEAAAEIARWMDGPTATRMSFDTPHALINDLKPDVPEPLTYEPRRKRFLGLF